MQRDPYARVRMRQDSRWFVYAVRCRVTLPRVFFIRFTHRTWSTPCQSIHRKPRPAA